MKGLVIYILATFITLTRTAPQSIASSSTTRTLIFQDYNEENEDLYSTTPQWLNGNDSDGFAVEEGDELESTVIAETTTTTPITTTKTTSGTRRYNSFFPTRNRNVIPSRRPSDPTPQFPTDYHVTTTTQSIFVDESSTTEINFDGDFRYIHAFRQYMQKFLENIRAFIRRMTTQEFGFNFTRYFTIKQNNQ